ncbi:MAG: Chromate resistance protein ChrB [Candidatus Dormibacteria bacterium]
MTAPPVRLPPSWSLLVYRVPSEPSNCRVSVWRDLKRMGGLYLQNCVCLIPNFRGMRSRVKAVTDKIAAMDGTSAVFEVRRIEPAHQEEVIKSFRALSEREYGEIIEECVTKFQREIEFERFRKNFSYEEAEEIHADLQKIRSWLERVRARDWFDCPLRLEAEAKLAEAERLFEAFERECYAAAEGPDMANRPGLDELIRTAAPRDRAPRRRTRSPALRR